MLRTVPSKMLVNGKTAETYRITYQKEPAPPAIVIGTDRQPDITVIAAMDWPAISEAVQDLAVEADVQEAIEATKVPSCFRVWFDDGSATLVDALGETQARCIVEAGIASGQYHGKIKSIEKL